MKCDCCNDDISHLALAQIHVVVFGFHFCSEVCAEMFLDEVLVLASIRTIVCRAGIG